jgi:hypothetical protein
MLIIRFKVTLNSKQVKNFCLFIFWDARFNKLI